jgi:hypothetical protein
MRAELFCTNKLALLGQDGILITSQQVVSTMDDIIKI